MTNEQKTQTEAVSRLLETLEDCANELPAEVLKAFHAVLDAIRERVDK